MNEWATVSEEVDDHGFNVITVESGTFKGLKFTYGAVNFDESEDNTECYLKFDYTILEGEVGDLDEFRQQSGDFLINILEKQLLNENVIYTGGTD